MADADGAEPLNPELSSEDPDLTFEEARLPIIDLSFLDVEEEAAAAEPEPAAHPGLLPLTYSALSLFRNCRRAYQLRMIDRLVPLETAHALRFGSLIHNALELWHGGSTIEMVFDHIDGALPVWSADPVQRRTRFLARAMMNGYAERYPRGSEPFEPVGLEKTFAGPIINPVTGRPSKTFQLWGKIDGVVRVREAAATVVYPPGYYVFETKTARTISGDYLERLWTDFQVTLYAAEVERRLGKPITGIIYNVLCKAGLKQSEGETEEEYKIRAAELRAKNKSGKTSAKRKLPETDEDFAARLAEWYAAPEAFHREVLFLDRSLIEELHSELWELTQAILDARRRGVWYKNSAYCFTYGRCPYFPLCRSANNPMIRENLYRIEEPNTELGDRDELDEIF